MQQVRQPAERALAPARAAARWLPRAQAAPTHPGAPPEQLGSAWSPPQLASGRSRDEDFPLHDSRCGLPKKGHVCAAVERPPSQAVAAEVALATPPAPSAAGPNGVHKRPRGRAPAGKTWCEAEGRWVTLESVVVVEAVVLPPTSPGKQPPAELQMVEAEMLPSAAQSAVIEAVD